jgi:hypothetical protein
MDKIDDGGGVEKSDTNQAHHMTCFGIFFSDE